MERIERIAAMEARLNKADAVLDITEEALDKLEAELADIKALTDYYGSEAWHNDCDADERGELPPNMPCGVLGEDYVYDVIGRRRELAIRMIELATAMLKQ